MDTASRVGGCSWGSATIRLSPSVRPPGRGLFSCGARVLVTVMAPGSVAIGCDRLRSATGRCRLFMEVGRPDMARAADPAFDSVVAGLRLWSRLRDSGGVKKAVGP